MAKAIASKTIITMTLTLSEEEAKYLLDILASPKIGPTPSYRFKIWTAIKDAFNTLDS